MSYGLIIFDIICDRLSLNSASDLLRVMPKLDIIIISKNINLQASLKIMTVSAAQIVMTKAAKRMSKTFRSEISNLKRKKTHFTNKQSIYKDLFRIVGLLAVTSCRS